MTLNALSIQHGVYGNRGRKTTWNKILPLCLSTPITEALLRDFLGVCKVDVSSGHSRENTEQAAFLLPTERFSAKEMLVFKEEHQGLSFPLDSPSSHAKQLF